MQQTTFPARRSAPSQLDGDNERFAHIVPKDSIVESAVNGTPVTALCSKTWIPTRDPRKFPLCPTCAEIAELAWGTSELD